MDGRFVLWEACESRYGVSFEGFTESSLGAGSFVNDTIAGNTLWSWVFDGEFIGTGGAPSPSIDNCIVWDNNGGGSAAQHIGLTDPWDPCDDSILSNSDWMNFSSTTKCSGGDGNIDQDPEFADSSGGDYHLTKDSTAVIDTAAEFPIASLPPLDVDGDDRTIDGGSGEEMPDMGADEYVP